MSDTALKDKDLDQIAGGWNYTDKYCAMCGDYLKETIVMADGAEKTVMKCCQCGWIRPD